MPGGSPGLLKGVVMALPGAAEVLRAAALAQRLDDRCDRRRALRRQPPYPPCTVEARLEVQVPVPEPAAGRARTVKEYRG
jgi:hypothetical protein